MTLFTIEIRCEGRPLHFLGLPYIPRKGEKLMMPHPEHGDPMLYEVVEITHWLQGGPPIVMIDVQPSSPGKE